MVLFSGTDANARNTYWNSRITDKAGIVNRPWQLLTAKEKLSVEKNEGDTTTFDNGRWTNSIDLTITNAMTHEGHDLMDRWKVASKDMDENCSDHNFITYNISPKSIIYLYFLYLRRDICLKPLYLFHFREAKYSKTWQTFHFIMHLTYCRHCLLNINFKLISGARFALFLCF